MFAKSAIKLDRIVVVVVHVGRSNYVSVAIFSREFSMVLQPSSNPGNRCEWKSTHMLRSGSAANFGLLLKKSKKPKASKKPKESKESQESNESKKNKKII